MRAASLPSCPQMIASYPRSHLSGSSVLTWRIMTQGEGLSPLSICRFTLPILGLMCICLVIITVNTQEGYKRYTTYGIMLRAARQKYRQQNFSDFKAQDGYLLLVLTMEQTTDNTTKIKELTYEQWQELSDRLDQIQATLDKLFLVEVPKKNKKEDKK